MTDSYRWVLDLIDRCYGAATEDDYWNDLLKDIRQFLDGHGATLFCTDTKLRPVDRFFGENVSAESIADYQAHFHSVDIRMQRSIPGALNSIVTDGDLVDDAIVDSHEFYQDFLRPIGHRYTIAAVMDLDDGHYAFCSCHLGLNQDHPDAPVLEKAGLIMPHIRRSLQLRHRLSTVDARGEAAFEVLDGLGQAVLLIDADGRIVWQNASADLIFRQKDGLVTSEGELRTLTTATTTKLQQLIKSAIAVQDQVRAQPGGMMMVPRPSLKRSYQVLVTPLARVPERGMDTAHLGVRPSAAIFVMDLDQKLVPRAEVLHRLYNLTPAEVRLATALGSGVSLKTYAERTKLSIHYVRWLLKQVEAKTETHRITDLIRLLARQTGFFGDTIDNEKENDR